MKRSSPLEDGRAMFLGPADAGFPGHRNQPKDTFHGFD
jgi:hypothetical protein